MLYILEQEFTLTTICTYTNLEPNIVEMNLSDLDKKRFLIRDLKDSGAEYFSLRQIIKSFIQKNNFFQNLENRQNIIKTHDRLKMIKSSRKINYKDIENIKYDYDHFLKRKDSDDEAIDELLWTNKKLHRRQSLMKDLRNEDKSYKEKILNEINKKDQEIINVFTFLKKKHPNYCEVYRVEGIFYGYLGSIKEMINSFETAIKLQPNYPNLRAYYIQHLRLNTQYDKSITMGLKCLELFPNNIEIEYQLLQTFYFSSIFNEKANSISEKNRIAAIKYKDIDLMFAKKLAKNSLEYQRRYNEYLIDKGSHEDFNLAYQNIIRLAENFKEFEDLNLIDEITTNRTIKKSFDELYHLKRYFSGDEKEEFIDGLIEVFKNKMDVYVNSSESFKKKKFIEKFKTEYFKIYEIGDTAEGVLTRILDKKIGSRNIITGGFIEIIKGKFRDFDGTLKPSIFIHSSQKISSIPVGSKITFKFDTFDGKRKSVVAINPKIIK